VIRPATMRDLRTIVGMGLEHYEAVRGKRYPSLEEVAESIKEFAEASIEDTSRYCAVATVPDEDGAIVGVMTGAIASVMPIFPSYLGAVEYSTWVDPQRRRVGFGAQLVEDFYNWAASHPLAPQMVFLNSFQHHCSKAAEATYRSCGFAIESKTFTRRIK
jgi:GNAT superfamily N-acetyltransferase